jgi:hypothetical protein
MVAVLTGVLFDKPWNDATTRQPRYRSDRSAAVSARLLPLSSTDYAGEEGLAAAISVAGL